MRLNRYLFSAVIGAVCAAVPLVGHADPSSSDLALAETLFRAAKDLMKDNKAPQACPKFAESYRLDPKLGTLINLADCHEVEGKTASAWGEFNEAVLLARKNNKPDREKLAAERAKALEAKLSKVTIEVEDPSTQISLDGHAVNAAVLGTPFPVDPGEHVIEASAPGKITKTTKLTVAASGNEKLKIAKLEIAEKTPAPSTSASASAAPAVTTAPVASAVPSSTAPVSTSWSTGKTAGAVLGGVGVAGVAIGGVFGLIAMKSHSSGDKTCVGTVCDAAGKKHQDDARRQAGISTVSFAVGGAFLAAGAVLFFTSGSSSSQTGSFHLAPAVGPSTAGFAAGGSF